MKKILLAFILIQSLWNIGLAQVGKGQVNFSNIPTTPPHYQEEYTYDTTLNITAWQNQKKGLHVSFASTNELYFRSEVPELSTETFSWFETGWKGDRLNTEILILVAGYN